MNGIKRRIDNEGRVGVPAGVRKLFGLETGDTVIWSIENDRIRVEFKRGERDNINEKRRRL